MGNEASDIRFVVVGFFVGMAFTVIFMLAGADRMTREMRHDAVEAGAAYYDPKTGLFTFGCTGETR